MKSRATDISSDFKGYDKTEMGICTREQRLIDHVMIKHDEVKEKCYELAGQIFDANKGKEIVLLCVINGAFAFYNDLL